MDGFPDPDSGGAVWRLALTLAGQARQATWVRVGSRTLILLPLAGEGWWAVDAACTGCRAGLPLPAAEGWIEQLTCTGCGHTHVPDRDDARGPPVMVVDDEVYVYSD